VLSLGASGWVHSVVFMLTGLFVIAAAIAFRRHLGVGAGHRSWGFLAFSGLMVILAGVSLPDPTGGSFSLHGTIHLAAGGLGFIAFAVATFIVARRFFGSSPTGWAWFSLAAGILLLAGFGALASGTPSAVTVLLFTATVILSWAWLLFVSLKFYREADVIGRADAAALKSGQLKAAA
jgi:hypothetical protein